MTIHLVIRLSRVQDDSIYKAANTMAPQDIQMTYIVPSIIVQRSRCIDEVDCKMPVAVLLLIYHEKVAGGTHCMLSSYRLLLPP